MKSSAFVVLTNKVNNLSDDDANNVICHVKKIESEMIDEARSICGELENVDSFIIYNSKLTYIKVECGNYIKERWLKIKDILDYD